MSASAVSSSTRWGRSRPDRDRRSMMTRDARDEQEPQSADGRILRRPIARVRGVGRVEGWGAVDQLDGQLAREADDRDANVAPVLRVVAVVDDGLARPAHGTLA